MGPGVRVEEWFSGMVPRPVSASSGSWVLPQTSQTRSWEVGPRLIQRLCDSLGGPELTQVREVMWVYTCW